MAFTLETDFVTPHIVAEEMYAVNHFTYMISKVSCYVTLQTLLHYWIAYTLLKPLTTALCRPHEQALAMAHFRAIYLSTSGVISIQVVLCCTAVMSSQAT